MVTSLSHDLDLLIQIIYCFILLCHCCHDNVCVYCFILLCHCCHDNVCVSVILLPVF